MYLKSIKINGFKSFVDKTNFELDKGITGIVGPNGSGKSNIVDAVRWVLGEQSVKSLRAEKNMSDVIFFGSKTRKPSNNASVTLVFDNTDHALNIDYNEVSIKRIVYNTGENEYYINNDKVRLKDITDLLLDSGSAKESFSIMSQGDVASIISSKPEERRVIFESASGVLKYKKRKEEATRKLDKTHDNIDRINDIISELEKEIEPLKKQSIDATNYKNAKSELENIEVSLIVSDIDSNREDLINSKNIIDSINNDLLLLNTDISKNDALIEDKKLLLNKENDALVILQNKLLDVTKEVEKINGEKNIINERNKLKADDVKVHNNMMLLMEEEAKYKNELLSLSKDIDEIKDNINNNYKLLSNTKISKNDIINNITKLNTKYNELLKNIRDNEFKISNLENSIESSSTYPYSVKCVLNNPKLLGIHDTIGNIITVPNEYSVCIDTSLTSSSYIIVDDVKSAEVAIKYLKDNNIGRCTFFPLNVIESKYIDDNTLNIVKNDKSFIDIASNLVNYDVKYKNIIENQLGNIIIVDNIKNANILSKKINHKYRIVTLDGDMIHVGGSLTGGKNKKSSSVILDKMELDKLNVVNERLNKELDILNNDINNLRNDLNNISLTEDDLIKKDTYYNELLIIKNNNYNEINTKLDTTNINIKSLDTNLKDEEEIINKYYEKVKEKEQIASSINKQNNIIKDIKDEIDLLEHNLKENNATNNKKQNELKELEIKVGKLDVKLDNLLNVLVSYNLTYEKAKENYMLTMSKDTAKRKVNELKGIIDSLPEVNLGATKEYERVKDRYEFLNNQKTDLFKAENTLLEIISEMDNVMTKEFITSFNNIKKEFKNVFKELFNGGDADIYLTDEENILESGIEITALPPGKKIKNIVALSGGEQALTSIALLFAILKVKPVPFVILDEVEAPLDEANVDLFGKYVSKMKDKTEFIIITHKKKTMEYADTLYGITMQEAGVSKLVSVRLDI